jgi:RNA polymerase sigma factor (sigma-70 family)
MSRVSPSVDDLRSNHERTSAAAWSAAYPWLWEAGMRVARCRLAGSEHEPDREDVVSTAVQQVVRGVIGNSAESFNQIQTFDDVLGMTRHIVRQRITDLLRSKDRRPEDVVEELPELVDATPNDLRFNLAELLTEVDHLQPDPPVPQVFRDRFVEGWSTDEIAARRSINRNTLLSHFAKGFRTLRDRLTRLEGALP